MCGCVKYHDKPMDHSVETSSEVEYTTLDLGDLDLDLALFEANLPPNALLSFQGASTTIMPPTSSPPFSAMNGGGSSYTTLANTSSDFASSVPTTVYMESDPDEQRLRAAAKIAAESGNQGPLLREELRLKIMQKRAEAGKPEIKLEQFKPKEYPLTAAEEVRKERRKEQNRRAARKCRQKKKNAEKSVSQVYQDTVKKNKALREQIERLTSQESHMHNFLLYHLAMCNVRMGNGEQQQQQQTPQQQKQKQQLVQLQQQQLEQQQHQQQQQLEQQQHQQQQQQQPCPASVQQSQSLQSPSSDNGGVLFSDPPILAFGDELSCVRSQGFESFTCIPSANDTRANAVGVPAVETVGVGEPLNIPSSEGTAGGSSVNPAVFMTAGCNPQNRPKSVPTCPPVSTSNYHHSQPPLKASSSTPTFRQSGTVVHRDPVEPASETDLDLPGYPFAIRKRKSTDDKQPDGSSGYNDGKRQKLDPAASSSRRSSTPSCTVTSGTLEQQTQGTPVCRPPSRDCKSATFPPHSSPFPNPSGSATFFTFPEPSNQHVLTQPPPPYASQTLPQQPRSTLTPPPPAYHLLAPPALTPGRCCSVTPPPPSPGSQRVVPGSGMSTPAPSPAWSVYSVDADKRCNNCSNQCCGGDCAENEALPLLHDIPFCEDSCTLSSKALFDILQDGFITSSQED